MELGEARISRPFQCIANGLSSVLTAMEKDPKLQVTSKRKHPRQKMQAIVQANN